MMRAYPLAVRCLAAFTICIVFSLFVSTSSVRAAVVQKEEKASRRAENALRGGEFEKAEKIYREMLEKKSRDINARLGLSFALLKQRKLHEAFEAAARVASLEPTSSRAHALLGATLLAVGDFRLASDEFRVSLSLNENEAISVAGLAMIDFFENRLDQSLSGLRRAAFLNPNEPDYHFNLGQVAARNERYSEAADSYERFLRVAPRTDEDRRARIRGLIDFLRYLGTQRNLLFAAGASRSQIPFELANSRPVIKVRINGSKDHMRFVIDTGAGMCVVSTTAAEKLGIKPVARGGNARAVGGGGKFDIVYGFLDSVQIGEARVDNVPVYIRPFFNSQEPIDGYIGLSIISKYISTLDYETKTLTLAREEARQNVNASVTTANIEIPMRSTSSGFWSGEIVIDGIDKPLNFIIDTGASISVVSSALATREEMDRFAQKSKLKIYGAAGVSEDVPMLILPRVRFGTHERKNVPAAVLDLEPINETSGFEQTGIIGGNILRHYRVTFDFKRGIVRMEPIGVGAPLRTDVTGQALSAAK